jgi:hypothetical protein
MSALNLFLRREPPPLQTDSLVLYLVKVRKKFFSPNSSYVDVLTSVAIRARLDLDTLDTLDCQSIVSRCEELDRR